MELFTVHSESDYDVQTDNTIIDETKLMKINWHSGEDKRTLCLTGESLEAMKSTMFAFGAGDTIRAIFGGSDPDFMPMILGADGSSIVQE